MSVSNGQLANAATFNGAFVSKSSDSTISATLTQDKESVLKEIATPSTPASGYGKIYFKADGKLYQLNDAGIETEVGTGGGGAGGVNFISNGNAEDNNTTGWATYADTAGTSPVDGTGGTANVTIASTATTPLAGTYSFLMAKDAVNRQGQGWSYAFTIDATYKAKVLQISFDYLVNSGTFAAGTSSTDSDVTVWIYDVTNAQVIQGSSYKLLSNSTSLTDTFRATFQSASNSTSYRLIFHVGSTSASAYTLEVDNVSVSPSVYVYGTPITDWQAYTPTTSGLGTISTVAMYWRRVGSSLEVMGNLTTGTVAASEAQIGLPSGLTSSSNISTIQTAGVVVLGTATSSFRNLLIETSKTYLTVGVAAGGSQLTKQNGTTFANTTVLSFQASVPIQGWSSSVQTSDSTDTRVVVARAQRTTTQSLANNTATKVQFDLVNEDTHGSFDSSTNYRYTIPVSGRYVFSGSLALLFSANNGVLFAALYVDGSSVDVRAINHTTNVTNANGYLSFIFERNLNAGQYVEIFATQVNSGAGSLNLRGNDLVTGASSFIITRLSGPSVVAASETVAMSAYLSANTAFGSGVTVKYDVKEFDSHGAYNSSLGQFVCPVSGTYAIGGLSGVQTPTNLYIYKNGSQFKYYSNPYTINQTFNNFSLIKLNAGDTVDIRQTTGSITFNGGALAATANTLSILRVGN